MKITTLIDAIYSIPGMYLADTSRCQVKDKKISQICVKFYSSCPNCKGPEE